MVKRYTTITTFQGKTRYIVGTITKESNSGVWIETLEGFNIVVYKTNIAFIDRA